MDKKDMRQLLEMSIASGRQGYKAAEVSLIRSVVSALVDELHTTANPTQNVPTTENQWGAGTNICRTCGQRKEMFQDESICRDCMTVATQPSSQSAQVDTQNGPAAASSGCAHQWAAGRPMLPLQPMVFRPSTLEFEAVWVCMKCDALRWCARTPAPAVDPTSSTSVKQASSESVESSVEESVKSQLNELIEGFRGLRNFEGKTDKEFGYKEGVLTAETFTEMKLRNLNRSK